jgi:hypothetical protein
VRIASHARAARLRGLVLITLWAHGCGSCGESAELREGLHPYRACLLADAPSSREISVNGATLFIDGRRARYVSNTDVIRIAAFRGADDELDDLARAASSIDEERVDLVFVLGGLGREKTEVLAHLEALSRTRRPLVLVPGGDDSLRAIDRALDALPEDARARVVDGRRTYILEAGGREWLIVPGAPSGRYAYSPEACGYEASDLDARRGELDGASHLLLAWAAPERLAGDAASGVFAFPGPDEDRDASRVFVGPIAGPPQFSDGAYRQAGPMLLEVGPQGLRAVGLVSFRSEARMVRPASP